MSVQRGYLAAESMSLVLAAPGDRTNKEIKEEVAQRPTAQRRSPLATPARGATLRRNGRRDGSGDRRGASRSGVYLLFVGLPSASVRRCEVRALLPEVTVEATAITLRWPLLSATRLVIFASFT